MRLPPELHRRGDHAIQRAPVGVKLGTALLLVLVAAIAPPSWPLFALLAAALLLIFALARLPARPLLRRLLLLEPLVLGIALLALLQPHGGERAALLLVRSTLCLSTMLLLAATTSFADLLAVLQRLRLPRLLLTTLTLMYRYLFVLADEAVRMHRARQSRSFTAKRWPGWKALATVVAQLFVRTTARAERVWAAMQARGYR